MVYLRVMTLLIQGALQIEADGWEVDIFRTVFEVIRPCIHQLILSIKAIHFPCTYCLSAITQAGPNKSTASFMCFYSRVVLPLRILVTFRAQRVQMPTLLCKITPRTWIRI